MGGIIFNNAPQIEYDPYHIQFCIENVQTRANADYTDCRECAARATRPQESQKVHPTSGSCVGGFCLDRNNPTTKMQMPKYRDANGRLNEQISRIKQIW